MRALSLTFALLLGVAGLAAGADADHRRLAEHYAPVVFQESRSTVLDFITSFDYDGDWKGDNNWRVRSNYVVNWGPNTNPLPDTDPRPIGRAPFAYVGHAAADWTKPVQMKFTDFSDAPAGDRARSGWCASIHSRPDAMVSHCRA